jgi:hypothetical protein
MTLPPEQRAARQRTAAEDRALELRILADHLAAPSREQHDAAIARLKSQLAGQRARARGGQYAVDDEA